MRTDEEGLGWIRIEANFGRIKAGSVGSFLKVGGAALDQIEKNYVVLM